MIFPLTNIVPPKGGFPSARAEEAAIEKIEKTVRKVKNADTAFLIILILINQ